jgi:hypothetical protein
MRSTRIVTILAISIYSYSSGQPIITPEGDTVLVNIFTEYPELMPIVNNFKLFEYDEFNPFRSESSKPDYNKVNEWLNALKPKYSEDTSKAFVKVWESKPDIKYILTESNKGDQKFIAIKSDTIEWLYASNLNVRIMLTPSGVYIWSLVFEKNGDITDFGYNSPIYSRNPDSSSLSLTKYIRSTRHMCGITRRRYWKQTGMLHYEYEYKNINEYKANKPYFKYEYDKAGNEIKRKQLDDNGD